MDTMKLIDKLKANHIKYNQNVFDYETFGEEDFLEWFKMELNYYEVEYENKKKVD